jgi:hypothetical protein
MEYIRFKNALFATILGVLVMLQSCSPKDTTIKADLATKAKSDKDFAGVIFTVEKAW